jgi:hypothetical protein
MGRRLKQKFNFPSAEETASLDSIVNPAATAEEIKADATAKKELKKAADEIPQIFSAEQVAFILHLYVFIVSFILAYALKVDFKKVHEELSLEPKEALKIAEPLARVISKHAPAKWAGMTAEIEIIAWLGVWTTMAYRRVGIISDAEKESKKKVAQNPQATTTPISSASRTAASAASGAIPL